MAASWKSVFRGKTGEGSSAEIEIRMGEDILFVSIYFLLFLAITVVCFFVVPVKWRSGVLLLASWGFLGALSVNALLVLLMITLFVYGAGLLLEKKRRLPGGKYAGGLLFAAIFVCVALLVFYKYAPTLGQRLRNGGWTAGGRTDELLMVVMPVGLSFYLFQAIGYLTDIYKGKTVAEKNLIRLSLYFAFFAKIVSGPIEREDRFLPQLAELEQVRFLNRGRLSSAFTYMLWGYFMKMVVADRLAVTAGIIFEGIESFDSIWLLIGALFYTFQIYCDFAGYSYIAIGCARIFGIRLTHNFEAPYCASSITDFWRRWHISLSSWLRDYIYIPLGGNRKGRLRKQINTMVVFVVCGMWHGSGLNFVVWGLLHGIFSVADNLWGNRIPALLRRILTFAGVALAWIFFRASGLRSALLYVGRLFTAGIHPERFLITMTEMQLSMLEFALCLIGIGVVMTVDIFCARGKVHLPDLIQKGDNALRYLIFYLLLILIFIFGMYGPGYHAEEFIYMQF